MRFTKTNIDRDCNIYECHIAHILHAGSLQESLAQRSPALPLRCDGLRLCFSKLFMIAYSGTCTATRLWSVSAVWSEQLSQTGCEIRLTLPQCILCSRLPHVSRGAGTGSNGWQGAVQGGALRGSQSCNTAEAPDPAVIHRLQASKQTCVSSAGPVTGTRVMWYCSNVWALSPWAACLKRAARGCVFQACCTGRLHLMSPLTRLTSCPGRAP